MPDTIVYLQIKPHLMNFTYKCYRHHSE